MVCFLFGIIRLPGPYDLLELSSLLVNMRQTAQMAVAVPLRTAIWNWIEASPADFNDVIRSKGRLEGAPERVFDLLHAMNQSGNERELWPTLTILHCITSERLTSDFPMNHFGYSSVPSQKTSSRKVRLIDHSLNCQS